MTCKATVIKMITCELQEECQFFQNKIPVMPSTSRVLKTKYCKEGACSACAIYIVFKKLGKEKVPGNLFPNQLDKVREILGFL
jgi:hypothetical protein